ncbi:DRAP deaminase [Savitreella phatthalungensis]
MDAFLAQATHQFTTLAIRSGISIAGGFAIKQVSSYIRSIPKQDVHKIELEAVSRQLDQSIKIVTPAIDLIEIIAARGNTTLNSTVQLTIALRNDINDFAVGMEGKTSGQAVLAEMRALLKRIEDAVPLISLALTTSGANLSASLPDTISPSRLLQASSFLQAGDARFSLDPSEEVKIGPTFVVRLYTIFEGHARQSRDLQASDITWQETYSKCLFELFRVAEDDSAATDQYSYHFRITEDLDDSRYHDEEELDAATRDTEGHLRGMHRDIPVSLITRLFFSASGRLLNIEEARTPVLIVKVNHALYEQTHKYSRTNSGEISVPQEDLEWLALELWEQEDYESDDNDDDHEHDGNYDYDKPDENKATNDKAAESSTAAADDTRAPSDDTSSRPPSGDSDVDALALQLQLMDVAKTQSVSFTTGLAHTDVATLSLLEYLLRLTALQTSEQQSCLAIPDERIALFLRDDNYHRRGRNFAGYSADDTEISSASRRAYGSGLFQTPASSTGPEDLIPGTRAQRSRSSAKASMPDSVRQWRRLGSVDAQTPVPATETGPRITALSSSPDTAPGDSLVETLATPHKPRAPGAMIGTPGSRRWQIDQLNPFRTGSATDAIPRAIQRTNTPNAALRPVLLEKRLRAELSASVAGQTEASSSHQQRQQQEPKDYSRPRRSQRVASAKQHLPGDEGVSEAEPASALSP